MGQRALPMMHAGIDRSGPTWGATARAAARHAPFIGAPTRARRAPFPAAFGQSYELRTQIDPLLRPAAVLDSRFERDAFFFGSSVCAPGCSQPSTPDQPHSNCNRWAQPEACYSGRPLLNSNLDRRAGGRLHPTSRYHHHGACSALCAAYAGPLRRTRLEPEHWFPFGSIPARCPGWMVPRCDQVDSHTLDGNQQILFSSRPVWTQRQDCAFLPPAASPALECGCSFHAAPAQHPAALGARLSPCFCRNQNGQRTR